MARLESHLATLFPQIDRLERFAERAWYRIAKGKKLLSQSFSALEDSKCCFLMCSVVFKNVGHVLMRVMRLHCPLGDRFNFFFFFFF